jgi:capsid protein
MSLINRIQAAGRALFRNQFDGATDNPQRSSTIYFPLDSTKEIKPYERREMIKKHRSLRNNLGVVRGIINTTVRLSIGWGLQPIPKSPDRDFNRNALAYWKRHTKSQNFDVSAQDKEPSMQRLVLGETITDGEIFGIKVVDDFGKPQRQLIKTEQVGDPQNPAKSDNWNDGILCNSLGRPLTYHILQNASSAERRGTRVDPRDILHIYDRERAHQRHGLPWGYTGLNHGVDALDIAAFEKITHKLNTSIIGTLSSQDGSVPRSMQGLLEAAAEATASSGTRTTRESAKYLDLHGSSIPIFKTSESMNLFLQGRNSINTIEFTGWLCAQYAHGFGLPVEVIVGMIQGSAAVRGNMELAGRFFEQVQMLMIDDWCQPNWENIIGTGLLAHAFPRDYPGIEPLAPPEGKDWTGWDTVEWRGPKNITIDRGRDGKMHLELIRSGLMTHEEYWTSIGEDPDEMDASARIGIKQRLADWLADGLPEDKFWLRELGQIAQNANPQKEEVAAE